MYLFERIPIERDENVIRARRTPACTRVAMGALGVALLLARPQLLPHPTLGLAGFALIALTSLVQLSAPSERWLALEESVSALAGVLIVGFAGEHVSAIELLWLVAIASGVLARGGRAHWLGRVILLSALALPIVRSGSLSGEYAAVCIAIVGLLLTIGRLTRELNQLLRQARMQADSAETLLLAGDIAARMAERGGSGAGLHSSAGAGAREDGGAVLAGVGPAGESRAREQDMPAGTREAFARLIAGEGLSMAVQPIVDVRSGRIHAYEALARFAQPGMEGSPLRWFSLAERFGERPALERACLRAGLELLALRPAGTSVSINLSAPVLLEGETFAMLERAGERLADGLRGLIVEITEETLVHGDMQLLDAIGPLRALGAQLAVDDMGAGYSGLRQITTVRPAYLKLDRSLVSGIDGDGDGERAALVAALAGYSERVGCLLIAEGIETRAELALLEDLGVPLIQGYYLARPGAPWPEVSAAPADASVAAPRAVRESQSPPAVLAGVGSAPAQPAA
jgi:EAL domain-containing protein (putative c-di-GMP-specific phosphodiesterase class I)